MSEVRTNWKIVHKDSYSHVSRLNYTYLMEALRVANSFMGHENFELLINPLMQGELVVYKSHIDGKREVIFLEKVNHGK